MPKQTQTSRKMAQTVREKKKEKAEPKELFKMKKFKNVPGRTETRRPKPPKNEVPMPVANPPEAEAVHEVAQPAN